MSGPVHGEHERQSLSRPFLAGLRPTPDAISVTAQEEASAVRPYFVTQGRVHDDLSGFETWRDALGIVPDDVDYHEQSDGRTRVLKASAAYAGAVLELIGYGDVPAPVPVGVAV